MRHIEALTAGVSRRAALQRQLLPILLGWLAEGVDPDAGLLAFRRVSEALGTTHWYLGMLRDSTAAAERLCHVLVQLPADRRPAGGLARIRGLAGLGQGPGAAELRGAVAGDRLQDVPARGAGKRHAPDPADPAPGDPADRDRGQRRAAGPGPGGRGAGRHGPGRRPGRPARGGNHRHRRGAAQDARAGGRHGPAGRPGDRLRLGRRRHVRPPRTARRPGGGGPAAGRCRSSAGSPAC